MTNPAQTGGPAGDGSRSLAKESKVGIAVSSILVVAVPAMLDWLTGLDTSNWTGRWATIGAVLVSGLVGALAAWRKANR